MKGPRMTAMSLSAISTYGSSAQSAMGLPSVESFVTGKRSGGNRALAPACLLFLLVLCALPGDIWGQVATPPVEHLSHPYILKMDVNMVVLHATVVDKKGHLVSGLVQDNFQIYEDGVLQEVKFFSHEDIPVTVGLVVDNSGSMKPKVTDVVAAALAFARSSNRRDQIFEVNFNEHVSFGLPDNMPFTDKVVPLEVALSTINASGQTALYDAIAAALEHIKQGNRDKKVLIVVSDGGDNVSKLHLAQILAMAAQSDVIIYTIGIFDEQDEDQNPDVLKVLAKRTGGEAYFPQSLDEVTPVCERIAHDIRNQYTLAYAPANKMQDGGYRVVQVKAKAPNAGTLTVRTRTGYSGPAASASPPTSVVGHGAHN
jgi:Ca-activated chloride channel family protein